MKQPYIGNTSSSIGQANSMACEQAVKQRTKEVPDSMNELGNSISLLRESLTDLYGTLSPIINQAPQGDTPQEVVIGSCELSRRLSELSIIVRGMREDVIKVRNALEI